MLDSTAREPAAQAAVLQGIATAGLSSLNQGADLQSTMRHHLRPAGRAGLRDAPSGWSPHSPARLNILKMDLDVAICLIRPMAPIAMIFCDIGVCHIDDATVADRGEDEQL